MLTAGLGEMGGAQPLAVTMNEGVGVIVEVDPWRVDRRLAQRQVDVAHRQPGRGDDVGGRGARQQHARSIALIGNAAEVLPELVARGYVPDVVTDQTSAHDPLTATSRQG